jgi:hypothetical protein
MSEAFCKTFLLWHRVEGVPDETMFRLCCYFLPPHLAHISIYRTLHVVALTLCNHLNLIEGQSRGNCPYFGDLVMGTISRIF